MSGQPEKRPAFEPATRLLEPTAYDPDMPRPASIVAGFALVLLRAAAAAIVLASVTVLGGDALAELDTSGTAAGTDADQQLALWIVLVGGLAVVLIDAALAVFIFLGHNWARVFAMAVSTVTIGTAFVAWAVHEESISIQGTLLGLSLDILLLLALSSRSAAAYARRKVRR